MLGGGADRVLKLDLFARWPCTIDRSKGNVYPLANTHQSRSNDAFKCAPRANVIRMKKSGASVTLKRRGGTAGELWYFWVFVGFANIRHSRFCRVSLSVVEQDACSWLQ